MRMRVRMRLILLTSSRSSRSPPSGFLRSACTPLSTTRASTTGDRVTRDAPPQRKLGCQSMTQHVTPYQCFISYVRNDNTDFDGVVDRLRASLGARFEATTGIPLHIFLDRESIGWGERWREKIFDSIAGSTLFLPIITMRYFNSSMCRDEFLAFHA